MCGEIEYAQKQLLSAELSRMGNTTASKKDNTRQCILYEHDKGFTATADCRSICQIHGNSVIHALI